MKNIHVLPTDKPSRLYFWENELRIGNLTTAPKNLGIFNQNIYITSDEEIKEGDYFIAYSVTIDKKPYISCASEYKERKKEKGKIILTTDVDLIKDGVQAIDDEFLEWFVKNPSCDEVPIITTIVLNEATHKTNIGFENWRKEEPKQETTVTDDLKDILAHLTKMNDRHKVQETLEEALSEHIKDIKYPTLIQCAEFGAKWRQERSYSEEEVRKIAEEVRWQAIGNPLEFTKNFEKWFETNKKK